MKKKIATVVQDYIKHSILARWIREDFKKETAFNRALKDKVQ